MAGLYAYDAAYQPNLAAVKAAPGAVAINGYLTGIYANTTTQPAAAHKAGLGWVATYEEGRSELVGASRATGQAVGRKILAALKAKGVPLDGTIAVYPSVDVAVPIDGTDRDADACNEAWRGIRDVLAGLVSIRAYAEGAVIDALASAGLVDGKCWLAAPTSWPGFDVNDANICMVQLVGTNVDGTDRNHLVTDPHALGAWWPDNSPYAEDDLPTPEEFARAVWAYQIKDPDTGKMYYAEGFLTSANRRAGEVLSAVNTVAKIIGTAGSGVADRVAAVQAAVDKVSAAVSALQPAAQVAVDAAQVADAVVAKLKALVWKVAP